MTVLPTFPFLICTQTSYQLHDITPEVLMAASRFFARFPPEIHMSDELRAERENAEVNESMDDPNNLSRLALTSA